jgi:protocatechuate 3,4-dioxygenase beta subunit
VTCPARAPPIHVFLPAPGRPPLVTQPYVGGEPGNPRDGLFQRLCSEARELVMLRPVAAGGIETGALRTERDIILA